MIRRIWSGYRVVFWVQCCGLLKLGVLEFKLTFRTSTTWLIYVNLQLSNVGFNKMDDSVLGVFWLSQRQSRNWRHRCYQWLPGCPAMDLRHVMSIVYLVFSCLLRPFGRKACGMPSTSLLCRIDDLCFIL